jgi:hypothetical protein
METVYCDYCCFCVVDHEIPTSLLVGPSAFKFELLLGQTPASIEKNLSHTDFQRGVPSKSDRSVTFLSSLVFLHTLILYAKEIQITVTEHLKDGYLKSVYIRLLKKPIRISFFEGKSIRFLPFK